MELVYRCTQHRFESADKTKAEEHIWRFHTPFKMSCLLNGRPSTGVCIVKEQYDSCQTPNPLGKVVVNNWMCWRDGILKEREIS